MRTMVLELSVPRFLLTQLLGRVSRAAYFGPTSPLRLVELPDAPLPAVGWVRVRNHLCGICGSDLHQIFLDAGLDVAPAALPSHRRNYLGHEMVGHIVEVSAGVTDQSPRSAAERGLAVGDRVVRWGRADDCRARGRAEMCPACARGHRVLCEHASESREHEPVGGGYGDSFITPATTLLLVPHALSDEQAILVEPAAVAIHAAWRRPPAAGERVLVMGCGTIGFLLIQALRALQPACEIYAIAQFPWQAEMALAWGAREVFSTHEDTYAQVARLTGAKLYQGRGSNRMLLGGMDVVYDVVGTAATLNNALRWTRARGTVVLVGVNLHRMTLDLTPVWYQEVDLLGAVGHDVVTWEGQQMSTFELAMRWMQEGRLDTRGLVTHRFPLEEYRQAFAVAVEKGKYRSIKVAFDLARKRATQ